MTDGFICVSCGYLRDTPNHELGCLPYHETRDVMCDARTLYDIEDSKYICTLCR